MKLYTALIYNYNGEYGPFYHEKEFLASDKKEADRLGRKWCAEQNALDMYYAEKAGMKPITYYYDGTTES